MATQRFEVTEYISDIFCLRTGTLPASRDEDSIMSYDEPLDIYTPRTESIAPSDSHDSITEYTPQSESLTPSESNEEPACDPTPMDLVSPDTAADLVAPGGIQFNETVEDSPMVDVGPTKEQQIVTEFPRRGQPRVSDWAHGGFSPSTKLPKDRGDEYLPSREQIEGLAKDQHRDDAETYKP